MPQTFTDPLTGTSYQWASNHETEDPAGKTRQIAGTANTGLTGRVRQQGDDGPYVVTLHGRIRVREQSRQFWHYYNLCRTQTIYFTDFDGQQYEVQIIGYTEQRVRQASNVADPSMPHHNIQYVLTMEVYGFLAGDLHDEAVLP